MSGREYTPHQILLLALHNAGAIVGKGGKTFDELVNLTAIAREELEDIIANQISSGYLDTSINESNVKRYMLTGRGIIRVASLYT